jgi:hypothetical protein
MKRKPAISNDIITREIVSKATEMIFAIKIAMSV